MRIGILGPAYPLKGGISQFSQMLAFELKKQHEVKLFSLSKQYPALFFPGKTQKEFSDDKPQIDIESMLVPYNPLTWYKALKMITSWYPDLIIIPYWIPFFAPCFGWLVSKLKKKNIKVFYLIHNLKFHEKWLLAKSLTKYALNNADALITLSDVVFDDAKKMFPTIQIIKGFHPIYNCYNLGNYTRDSARRKLHLADQIVILFFGYIKPYKGLELLINAFPEILEEMPNAHLLIAGEVYGDDLIYFKLIEKLSLQDNVTFHNRFVAREEVELYFKAADVLALPYLTATQSGVVQIAYDFGLGAVCTPVGGLPELVIDSNTGKVAEEVSEEDFADAVIDYFEMDEIALRKNIAAQRNRYSWQRFAEIIIQ